MTGSRGTLVHFPSPSAPFDRSIGSDADLLTDFFGVLKPTSRRTYRQRLTTFANWIGCPLEMLPIALMGAGRGAANQLVLRYKGHLLAQGTAPSTINVSLSAIRSLVAMARMVGRVEWAVEIKSVPAQTYRDTVGPGLATLRRLLAHAEEHRHPRMAARDTLIIRLLYDLALRCNELTTLEVEHVELDATATPVAVHILGKGQMQRLRRTLPPACVSAIAGWLAVRGPEPGSLVGLSNRGVAKALERLAAAAKLEKIHPHSIRHTSITVALEQNNGNIVKTMDHSRHASPATVMKYNDNRLNSAGEMADAVSLLL